MPTCLIPLLLAVTLAAPLARAQQDSEQKQKAVLVSIAVEAEGPSGLWAQSSKDLTKHQLQELESMLKTGLSKAPSIRIVDMNDPADHMHLTVVAAQLERSGGRHWFITSTAVTIAKSQGGDVLASHDVIAGPDLLLLARSIILYFHSLRLNAATSTLDLSNR